MHVNVNVHLCVHVHVHIEPTCTFVCSDAGVEMVINAWSACGCRKFFNTGECTVHKAFCEKCACKYHIILKLIYGS